MPFFDCDPHSPDRNLDPDQAWNRLPILAQWGGLPVRWVGPLFELGVSRWVSDFGMAGWGYLRSCGWVERLQQVEFRPEGRLETADPPAAWQEAFAAAVDALAEAGERAGPSGDRERWAAWIGFEWSSVHDLLRERYEVVEAWIDSIPDEVWNQIEGHWATRSDFRFGPGYVAGDERRWDPPVDLARALAFPAQARTIMKRCRVELEDGTSVFFERGGFTSIQQDVPEPGLEVPLRAEE